jgi:hypothetical protein
VQPYLIQHIDFSMNIQTRKVGGGVPGRRGIVVIYGKWSNMNTALASLGKVGDAWRGYMNGQRMA